MSSVTSCCLSPAYLIPLSKFWKAYPQNDKGNTEIVPLDNEVVSAFSDTSVGDFTPCWSVFNDTL